MSMLLLTGLSRKDALSYILVATERNLFYPLAAFNPLELFFLWQFHFRGRKVLRIPVTI